MKKLHSLLLVSLIVGIAPVVHASQMTRSLALGSLVAVKQRSIMMPWRNFSTNSNDSFKQDPLLERSPELSAGMSQQIHEGYLKSMLIEKKLGIIASDKMSFYGIGANVASLVLTLGLAPLDPHLALGVNKLSMASCAIVWGSICRSAILAKQVKTLEDEIKAQKKN